MLLKLSQGFNNHTKDCVISSFNMKSHHGTWSQHLSAAVKMSLQAEADEANVVIPAAGEPARLFPAEIAASTGQSS